MDAPAARSKRWAYGASIDEFLRADPNAVLGALTVRAFAGVEPTDTLAWRGEVDVLQRELASFQGRGQVYFEYEIPRMGKRADVIVIVDHALFVLEFKVGAKGYAPADIAQVWDYALDLKYFQSACRDIPIIPILVATNAASNPPTELSVAEDGVTRPIRSNATGVRNAIEEGLVGTNGLQIDPTAFEEGRYQPTPTIVEAARSLYANHSVEEITRRDAGAINLAVTSARVNAIIAESKRLRRKAIVFVTGVPGAGKTLVGLDVATKQADETDHTQSVFLSGNGPLVSVLQTALARDKAARTKAAGSAVSMGTAMREVKVFIQNVHHFRDDCLADPSPPTNNIALFDEAQRAWDLAQTSDFMRRKKEQPDFNQSEPQFLISCMDRHEWAVVVCLVGGGQEINRGEAGIREWLAAIGDHFPQWVVHLSPRLAVDHPQDAEAVRDVEARALVHRDADLHLSTSIRSFRSERVSSFVNDLLDLRIDEARTSAREILANYPIGITRDISAAKRWLRDRARGTERYGLVASSGAQRLRPLGVDVRVNIDPVHWFLHGQEDVRSSYYLEDVATEFQVQGLELDWTCVVWDADLRLENGKWAYYNFSGTRWQNVNNERRRRYLLNTYRVLLTRARQGMVIVVPEGCHADATRRPEFYDAVFNLLVEAGFPPLESRNPKVAM